MVLTHTSTHRATHRTTPGPLRQVVPDVSVFQSLLQLGPLRSVPEVDRGAVNLHGAERTRQEVTQQSSHVHLVNFQNKIPGANILMNI